jgi:hypothetical protein
MAVRFGRLKIGNSITLEPPSRFSPRVRGGCDPRGSCPPCDEVVAAKTQLAHEIVQDLLNANFPESIHQDILDAVGTEFTIETWLGNRSQP